VGIELPAELADIAGRVGAKWPEADEDALHEQANAWREAARGLRALATDADSTAAEAVSSMAGEAAEQAGREWSTFVAADSGLLTGTAQEAERAADRLDHAARQVGAAKVEIVRQLVDAARTEQAAAAAADGGHPEALLSLETLRSAVSTNVTVVTESLADAVADTGREVTTSSVVSPHPGHNGTGSLLEAVIGATDAVTETVEDEWDDVEDEVTDLRQDARQGVGEVRDVVRGGVEHAGDVVREGVEHPRDAVHEGVGGVRDVVRGGVEHAGDVVREGVEHPRDAVHEAAGDIRAEVLEDAEDVRGHAPGHADRVPDNVREGVEGLREHVEEARGDISEAVPHTGGPVPDGGPDALTPPMGNRLPAWMEAPTPRTGVPMPPQPQGQTSLAGFVDGGVPPMAQPPAPPVGGPLPPAAGPIGQPMPAPGGAPPPAMPGVVGGDPSQAGQQPGRQAGGIARVAAGGNPAARPGTPPPAAWTAGASQAPNVPARGQQSGVAPPQPEPQPRPAPEQPTYGTPRKDRATIVALFRVHMFPIGHLPKATSEPSRQLPIPTGEADAPAALRFPPHDHPESAVFDDAEVLPERAAASPGLDLDHPALAPLFDDYDPLADSNEAEWERRYLVKADREPLEYAWPPGEAFPEGCAEPGVPVLLEPGTIIDRFGEPRGRVFHPDGTAYRKRSLPPPGPHLRYRRYAVLRPLPVWRGIVAPWFGQPGGAERFRTVYPADDLVVLGFLRDVTDELTDTDAGEQPGGSA